mgnify:CR=1 FL=1
MRDNWFCFLPHPQTMDSVIDKVQKKIIKKIKVKQE